MTSHLVHTSTSLWTWNFVWDRLLEEISEVLGDKSSVSPDDLEKLTYTEQVGY